MFHGVVDLASASDTGTTSNTQATGTLEASGSKTTIDGRFPGSGNGLRYGRRLNEGEEALVSGGARLRMRVAPLMVFGE